MLIHLIEIEAPAEREILAETDVRQADEVGILPHVTAFHPICPGNRPGKAERFDRFRLEEVDILRHLGNFRATEQLLVGEIHLALLEAFEEEGDPLLRCADRFFGFGGVDFERGARHSLLRGLRLFLSGWRGIFSLHKWRTQGRQTEGGDRQERNSERFYRSHG